MGRYRGKRVSGVGAIHIVTVPNLNIIIRATISSDLRYLR